MHSLLHTVFEILVCNYDYTTSLQVCYFEFVLKLKQCYQICPALDLLSLVYKLDLKRAKNILFKVTDLSDMF